MTDDKDKEVDDESDDEYDFMGESPVRSGLAKSNSSSKQNTPSPASMKRENSMASPEMKATAFSLGDG